MIDRSTGWIEAATLVSITLEKIAHVFIATWVSRVGEPLYS